MSNNGPPGGYANGNSPVWIVPTSQTVAVPQQITTTGNGTGVYGSGSGYYIQNPTFDWTTTYQPSLKQLIGADADKFEFVPRHFSAIEPSEVGSTLKVRPLSDTLSEAGIYCLSDNTTIAVPIAVWRAIVMFMKDGECYAGLSLVEFLRSTLNVGVKQSG